MVAGKNFEKPFDGRKNYEQQVYMNEQEIDEIVKDAEFL